MGLLRATSSVSGSGGGLKHDEMEVPEVGLWTDLHAGGETKDLTSLPQVQFIPFSVPGCSRVVSHDHDHEQM